MRQHNKSLVIGLAAGVAALVGCGGGGGPYPTAPNTGTPFPTTLALSLISRNVAGTNGGNGASRAPRSTPDGRYVVFDSDATDLVGAGIDTNGQSDIFLHDRQTGVTSLVGLGVGGVQPNGTGAFNPDISNDGRFIVFQSNATNLGFANPGNFSQVYLRDMLTGAVTLMSRNAGNTGAGNNNSFSPRIAGAGEFAIFTSSATDLLPVLPPNTDSNGLDDVYRVDFTNGGAVTRVSLATAGAQIETGGNIFGGAISDDGQSVVYISSGVAVVAGTAGGSQQAYCNCPGGIRMASRLSGNGAQFSGAVNAVDISGDGTKIHFLSSAGNADARVGVVGNPHLFMHDVTSNTTSQILDETPGAVVGNASAGTGVSVDTAGRFAAIDTTSTNLDALHVTGARNEIHVRDVQVTATPLRAIPASGNEPASSQFTQHISGSGRYVHYMTQEAMIAGDTNGQFDIYASPNPF